MELFYFDIETAGQYKNYDELNTNDLKGSILFKSKYDKMFSKDYDNINDAYINNAGIISTYGQIVCISCGLFNDGSKKISSLYNQIYFWQKTNYLLYHRNFLES